MMLYGREKKEEVDSLLRLDTAKLKKNGYLTPNKITSGTLKWSRSGICIGTTNITAYTFTNPLINISYFHTAHNQAKKLNYSIKLTTTKCNLGGFRWWFECPACNIRVRVLYKAGSYFVCRHCGNLTYESKNENRRHPIYFLGKTLLDSKYLREFEGTLKRKTYQSRPTRKQKLVFERRLKIYRERIMHFSN